MRLLLGLWNGPYMMGYYYHHALKKHTQHQITTAGPSFLSEKSDFNCTPGQALKPYLNSLNETPDAYVQFYSKPEYFPRDLDQINIPKFWYIYDTHIHLDTLATAAYLFDVVFCPNKADQKRLKDLGLQNVEILEFAADPQTYYREVHTNMNNKKHPLGFAGSAWGHSQLQERERFLKSLVRKHQAHIEHRTLIGPQVADFLAECQISINHAIGNEVNMRISEALLAGSPLLTPMVEDLEDYIPLDYLNVYQEHDVDQTIKSILEHPELALKKAKQGQDYVLQNHTYEHRATFLLKKIEEYLDIFKEKGLPPKDPNLIQAAKQHYLMFRFPGDGLHHLTEKAFLGNGLPGTLQKLSLRCSAELLRVLSYIKKGRYFEDQSL